MAKIDRARQNFAAIKTPMICPICGQKLALSGNSFICAGGHCYDLAAANYLNLAPGKNTLGNLYDETLFATRRRVFAAGFYDDVCAAIEQLVYPLQPRGKLPLCVVDAGCGEGFFARSLQGALGGLGVYNEVFALDLAKPGVLMAAKAAPGSKCLLADLARLPLADHSVDVLLNVLSPANYREFARVLAPGGLLIKVVPGAGYLQQVRAAYGLPPGGGSDAAALFAENTPNPTELTEKHICTTLPVSPDQAADFLQMTPLSDHRTAPAANFDEITIDLHVLAAKY